MKVKLKPETIARLARERAEASAKSKAELIRRLREKAEAEPTGIWGELLAEALAS